MSLSYEGFIRGAFGYPYGLTERGEDPAGLAEQGHYNDGRMDHVVPATSYAMWIYIRHWLNAEMPSEVRNREHDRVTGFPARVLSAKTVVEVDKLIEEFRSTVVNRYWDNRGGIRTFKSLES